MTVCEYSVRSQLNEAKTGMEPRRTGPEGDNI